MSTSSCRSCSPRSCATAGGVVYLLLLGGATPEVTTANFTLDVAAHGRDRRSRDALGSDARRLPLHLRQPAARRPIARRMRSTRCRASFRPRCSSRSSCSECSSSSSSSSSPAASFSSSGGVGQDRATAAGGGARMNIKWDSHGDGPALLLIQGLGYGRWGWDPVVPGPRRAASRAELRQPRHRRLGQTGRAIHGADDGRRRAPGARRGGRRAGARRRREPRWDDRAGACGTGARARREARAALYDLGRARSVSASRSDPEADGGGAGARAGGRTPPLHRERAGASPSESLVDEIFALRVANPPDPAGWQAQAAAGTTFLGVDGAIEAPTLVLHGTEDNVVDVRNSELLAGRIPGARLVLVPGTGHLFFWERPEAFLAPVTEFLA